MDRAFSKVTIKSVSEDRREFEGWASTPTTDRQLDQLMPEGAKFELPLPFLLDHDSTKVVGEVYKAEVSSAGIRFWARITKIAEPGAAKELCDYAWQLIKNKLRPVVSVGFRPLEWEPIGNGGGQRFLSWEWFELSGVGIAAQPEARVTGAKSGIRSRSSSKAALRSPPGHISVQEHERRQRQLDATQTRGAVAFKELRAPKGHISLEEHEKRRKALNRLLVKSGQARAAPCTVVRVGPKLPVVKLGG